MSNEQTNDTKLKKLESIGAAVKAYKYGDNQTVPCPFCGEMLMVTHVKETSSYWIECSEKHILSRVWETPEDE